MSLPDESRAPVEEQDKGSPWFTGLTIALLVVAVVAGILWLIPANYYMFLPGEALSVEPMITVQGHKPLHTRGTLYMTDVTIYKVNHLIEELYGRINSQADLSPAQDVAPGLSEKQYLTLNASLMSDSKQQAVAAALNAVPGYQPRYSSRSPQVVFIMPHTPAAAKLKVGDVILAVNGVSTHREAANVAPVVKRMQPGQEAHLSLLRGNRRLQISVRTIASSNGVPNPHGKTPLIGIYVQDKLVFPVHVRIRTGLVGGPSAGLMFTLGIIEQLEGRDLTHGCKVAGTGAIDATGQVGAIGGARQKILAAEQVGAKYFFVPNVRDHDNLLGALSARDGITVVPVSNLRQALSFLAHLKPCR